MQQWQLDEGEVVFEGCVGQEEGREEAAAEGNLGRQLAGRIATQGGAARSQSARVMRRCFWCAPKSSSTMFCLPGLLQNLFAPSRPRPQSLSRAM